MTSVALQRKNLRVGLLGLLAAAGMLGLGYAAVPLYQLFCQVTGFGGTTQRATEADADLASRLAQSAGGKTISIRFDASTSHSMPWMFEPEQTGEYFNKIQCFCFTEQTLQPGQEVRMPVLFYVDPAILEDPNAKGVEQITLSYTFHRKPDSES